MAGLTPPDVPEGVLNKTAQTAYRTILWVFGLVMFGAAAGAFLTLALHNSAGAAVIAAPAIQTDDIERLERKIDKVDDRVRDLQNAFAALEQQMKDREERTSRR